MLKQALTLGIKLEYDPEEQLWIAAPAGIPDALARAAFGTGETPVSAVVSMLIELAEYVEHAQRSATEPGYHQSWAAVRAAVREWIGEDYDAKA